MIDYQTYHRIHHLYNSDGLNVAQIARELDLHDETVAKWLERDRYEPRASVVRATKLDPYKPGITRLLDRFPYTARQVFQQIRAEGYDGGYTQLKGYVARVRPRPVGADLELEFAPGECLQWDWADCGLITVGQARRKLYALLMELCWSRLLFVEFTLGHCQEHFLACHRHGLEAFGGRTRDIMCDNDRVAILKHARYSQAVLTPLYHDLVAHYGFENVRACTPGQAHEKGLIEAMVHYLRVNFLAGRTLSCLTQANVEVRDWLDTVANVRLHAKTHRRPLDMFAAEQPRLEPLPPLPYDCGINSNVQANRQCRVNLRGRRHASGRHRPAAGTAQVHHPGAAGDRRTGLPAP